jgi:hypothetical protein
MAQRNYTFDANNLLENGLVAIAASRVGQATINGTLNNPQIIDVGLNSRLDAMALIDVSAITAGGADQAYRIVIQGSSSATFASDIENLAEMTLGNTAVRPGGAKTSTPGRYELPFTNYQDDTSYRYLRANFVVAGTTPSITARVAVMLEP